jgi:tetratricopeptide (TPR) repeat protein
MENALYDSSMVLANARYWLDFLKERPSDTPLPPADIEGGARGLSALLEVQGPEAWSLAMELALALHTHMKRHVYWTEWEGFIAALLHRAFDEEDAGAEAQVLLMRGGVQRAGQENAAAVSSYYQAWQVARRAGRDDLLAIALSNLGDLYRSSGQLWRAGVLIEEALRLFEQLGDDRRGAYTENNLGLVCWVQGRWEEALACLERARVKMERLGDVAGMAAVFHNLGEFYLIRERLDEAVRCCEKATDYYRAVGDEANAVRVEINLGGIYWMKEDYARAEELYLRLESRLQRFGDELNLARARHNLGVAYTSMENWREAQLCFDRAMDYWQSEGDGWNRANTLSEMITMYLRRGLLAEARAALHEAEALAAEGMGSRYDSLREELREHRRCLDEMA